MLLYPPKKRTLTESKSINYGKNEVIKTYYYHSLRLISIIELAERFVGIIQTIVINKKRVVGCWQFACSNNVCDFFLWPLITLARNILVDAGYAFQGPIERHIFQSGNKQAKN